MSSATQHIRHGVGAVRPYLYGTRDLPDFVQQVFGAVELERAQTGGGAHVEVRIGDSVVVLEIGDWSEREAPQGQVYVYVPDVDAAYQRARSLGARSIAAPEQKPYGERGACVQDAFGNTWWIATFQTAAT